MRHTLWHWLGRIGLLAAIVVPGLALPGFVQASYNAPSGSSAAGMLVQVTAVEVNSRITVQATGFPANVDFMVRIGPFYNFWKQQSTMANINSGAGGSFQFNVNLPDSVKDVNLVTLRLDSTSGSYHYVSYNAFVNATNGTIGSTTLSTASPTATPHGATPVPTVLPSGGKVPIVENGCTITAITPTVKVPTNYDFDAVWTVKNTGTANWDNHAVDILYLSGQKMGKFSAPYDLPKYLKPGDDAIDISVDMVAPATPGTYTTTWQVHGDRGVLCELPLTLIVK
jgi:hypothetical protein